MHQVRANCKTFQCHSASRLSIKSGTVSFTAIWNFSKCNFSSVVAKLIIKKRHLAVQKAIRIFVANNRLVELNYITSAVIEASFRGAGGICGPPKDLWFCHVSRTFRNSVTAARTIRYVDLDPQRFTEMTRWRHWAW